MKQFIEQLKTMRGGTFIYAGKQYKLIDYSVDDLRCKVSIRTDKRTFEKTFAEAGEFLDLWQKPEEVAEQESFKKDTPKHIPVVAPAPVVTQPAPVDNSLFDQNNALANDLIDILKENIDKVRKDPGYIKQAQAINNNINSIINVTKLKLDVYKQFKPKR